MWEFATVRGHTVLGPGASVGFNCEVPNTYIGACTVLGHRIGINRTLLGDGVHLSADVTVTAIHLTRDMTRPTATPSCAFPTASTAAAPPGSAP